MITRLPQRADRTLLLVLSVACLGFAIGIGWGLPRAVSPETVAPWEMDSVAPIMPLNEAYYRFTREGNQWPAYPLFHFIVLDIVYAPYLALQYFSGNLENPSHIFPYGMKDPIGMARDLTLLARIVSLVMALGIVILIYRISAELFSTQAALWASLMTTLLAPLTYYAKTSNLDVPYIFWSCLAFWQYIRIMKFQHLTNYLGFATSAALAIATKDQAYGFFLLIPWIIVYTLARHRANGPVGMKDLGYAVVSKPIILSLITAVGVFAIANNLVFGGWSGFLRHIGFNRAVFSQRLEMFPYMHTVGAQLALLIQSGQLLVQTFGYGSLLLCLGGIVHAILKRHWFAVSILLFPLSYYIFTLAVFAAVFPRYLLGPAILLTTFSGALIADLLGRQGTVRVVATLGILGSLLWQIALTANLTLTLVKDSRYEAEAWIKAHIPPGATIESQLVPENYLPHISRDYKVSVKGLSGELNEIPLPQEVSAEALGKRDPEYILLGSLGNAYDPENWQDGSLIEYRDSLLSGKLGYKVLAIFETPHFISYRQLTGTRPKLVLLAKSSRAGSLRQAERSVAGELADHLMGIR